MREAAVGVRGIRELRAYAGSYSRVYFGAEFCERLLPTPGEVARALRFCREKDKAFTLAMPCLTDRGLAGARKLLARLPEGTEVVLNDWGLLEDLEEFNLTPVLGRLLVKYRRDPRVEEVYGIPAQCGCVLHSSALTQERFAGFLRKLGVCRIELDNPPFRVDHGSLRGFRVSVHLPYVYVTTGRQCLTNYFADGVFGIRPCGKACLRHSFTWESPDFPTPLVHAGNTLCYVNEAEPAGKKADRLVYHPTIP